MDTKYNGWTNYETWCVNLWLTNDEHDYSYWNEQARQAWTAAPNTAQALQNRQTAREVACILLAEQLKDAIYEHQTPNEPSVYSDLLSAALAEVHWFEIADGFLEDFAPVTLAAAADDTANPSPAQPRFDLGRVVCTPGVLAAVSQEDIAAALSRHERGDWGLVGDEDRAENELSLQEGFRLLSVYETGNKTRFWIITEADRSVTTVLLPSDY